MSQRPSFWTSLVDGTGQALPILVLTSLMGFGTLMVNVQIQISELKLRQDETLRVLERSEDSLEKTLSWIRAEVDRIEERVGRLEGRNGIHR